MSGMRGSAGCETVHLALADPAVARDGAASVAEREARVLAAVGARGDVREAT